MNIWITGSSGFLGGRLASFLAGAGHQVVGLSRRRSSSASKEPTIDLASEDAIHRLRNIADALGDPEVVVHAAGLQPANHQVSDFVRSNVLSTANLLDALDGFPPSQIIYTSTLKVYGCPEGNPVNESHPARAVSTYEITKLWSEQLLEMFQGRSQVTVLRLPSLYGTGQRDSFVDALGRSAIQNEPIELYANGKVVRDTLHVDDAVKAILQCISSPPAGQFCRFNLGCGQPITSLEYAEALVEALDSRSHIETVARPSPQQFDFYADISKAKKELGFEPTPLLAAMRRYADELRTQS